jgi:WD40 repeat protein
MKSRTIPRLALMMILIMTGCEETSHEQVQRVSTSIPTTVQTNTSTATISPSSTPDPTSTQTPSITHTATLTPSPSITPFLFASTPLAPLRSVDANQSLVRLSQIKIPSKYSGMMYFSPHHPVLYFTGAGLLVKRLDLTCNDYLPDLLGPVHFSPAFLATSPDDLLIAGSDMNRIIVWDLQTSEIIQILEPTLNTLRGLYFTNNDDILVSVDYDGNIIRWDRWSWEEISRTELDCEQKRVMFVPRGDGALVLDDVEGVLPVVDLDGRPLSSIELPTRSYRFVSVSQDGKELMIQVHGAVKIYDIATGEEVFTFSMEGIRNVAVTPNWTLLAAIDADLNVHIIDLTKGDILFSQKMDFTSIRSLAISPDGNLIGLYIIGPDMMTPYIEVWGVIEEVGNEP